MMLNVASSLDELKYPHAFIGGFAWSLLGSRRPTQILTLVHSLFHCRRFIGPFAPARYRHPYSAIARPIFNTVIGG
jgi:hypothetical protein